MTFPFIRVRKVRSFVFSRKLVLCGWQVSWNISSNYTKITFLLWCQYVFYAIIKMVNGTNHYNKLSSTIIPRNRRSAIHLVLVKHVNIYQAFLLNILQDVIWISVDVIATSKWVGQEVIKPKLLIVHGLFMIMPPMGSTDIYVKKARRLAFCLLFTLKEMCIHLHIDVNMFVWMYILCMNEWMHVCLNEWLDY